MNNKPAIIIPAWKHGPDHAAYANVTSALKVTGHHIIGQSLRWNSGTVERWQAEIVQTLHGQKDPITMCAYELGAMPALAAATMYPIENLILCSPHGYYKEYITKDTFITPRWMGDIRKAEFAKLSSSELLRNLKVKNARIILDEAELIGRPAHQEWIHDLIEATGWEVTTLPHESYGLMSPGYQKAVVTAVKEMSGETLPTNTL